jgi:capsular exopolysaccharide synthesis family protein
MSHVDKALKAWEAQARIPRRPAPERFRLDQYLREDPAAAAAEPPQPRPPVEATPPVQPAARPVAAPRPETFRQDPEVDARLVTGGSGAVPLEQYRRLAAVLHDVQLQQGLKTLMLTSALPHEGKTLTVVNLALTLSESYARRVLIIDADLRWPALHTVFGVNNHTGLSEALLGQGLALPIHQVSQRLSVLPAGRPGPTPLAALTSARMGALIDECATQFDWVLLDTPPVGLMPDAQLLARLTRAVVLVIAAGATPAAAVQRAVEELGPDSIIGTVLNRVDARTIPEVGYYAQYADRPDQ